MNILAAGGLMGAGQFGQQLQRAWNAEDLQKLQDEAANMRQQALIAAQASQQKERLAHDVTMKSEVEPQADLYKQGLLAPGKEREADLAAERSRETERQKPRIVPEGSTLREPGQADFTPPKTAAPKPQEELDAYKANANRLNAEADAIRDGLKYRDRGAAKPQLPHIVTEKLEDGTSRMVDSNSGATGQIIPGTPAKPTKSHWFSADEPAVPAGADNIRWSYNGKVLPNGLSDIYPDIRARSGAGESGRSPDVAPAPGARQAPDGKWYRPREGGGFERVDVVPDAATAAPARPTGILNAPTPTPAKPAAPAYESYIEQRRSGLFINAPAKSPAAKLNGRSFSTREEALQALRDILE